MNFSDLPRKKNIFLLPISWLYIAGVFIYHKLYDSGIRHSEKPAIPAISIGNLSVGGTGKSPMTEHLVRLLKDRCNIAVLSRGYKRKTKGFVLANDHSNADDIGDEPMQFLKKFPGIKVAVDEKRLEGIEKLKEIQPQTDLVVLDDALQHRPVKAGLTILLTGYHNLFVTDLYLPAGSLRDLKSSYKRADIIVVTKCRKDLDEKEKDEITRLINPAAHQHVFFAAMDYGAMYHIFSGETINMHHIHDCLLITGIANPDPLLAHLRDNKLTLQHIAFKDHHHFTVDDIRNMIHQYKTIKNNNTIILTTEKDAMRLLPFKEEFMNIRVYAIPVTHQFLFNRGMVFDKLILDYIQKYIAH